MKRGKMKPLSDLGLHQMGKHFQKTYIEQQCKELIKILDASFEITECNVPIRENKFMLNVDESHGVEKPRRWEYILERAIWRQFNKQSQSDEFLPGKCSWIRSFQVPLRRIQSDPSKAIDLLGVARDSFPVVIELKTDKSKESPLRALVEAVAYGIALRKNWNSPEKSKFREEWNFGLPSDACPCPGKLKKITLICIAPSDYWSNWKWESDSNLNIRKAMGDLILRLSQKGFNSYFAKFEYSERKNPEIKSASIFFPPNKE